MWIALPDSFISVVAHRKNPDRLVVRARDKDSLLNLFPEKTIHFSPDRDYAYRTIVSRIELTDVMVERIEDIDYHNFKNEAKKYDTRRAQMFSDMWFAHWNYQHELIDDRSLFFPRRRQSR